MDFAAYVPVEHGLVQEYHHDIPEYYVVLYAEVLLCHRTPLNQLNEGMHVLLGEEQEGVLCVVVERPGKVDSRLH
jgi:hypothetical protein